MERRRVLQLAAASALASFWDTRLESSFLFPKRKKVINVGFVAFYARINHLKLAFETVNDDLIRRTAGEYSLKILPRTFSEPTQVLAALQSGECDLALTSPTFWHSVARDLHPISHGPNFFGKEKFIELIASESFQSELNSIYKQLNLETQTLSYLYADRIRLSVAMPSPATIRKMTFASTGWMSEWLTSQNIRTVHKTHLNDLTGTNVSLPIPHFFIQILDPQLKQSLGERFIDTDSVVPRRIELAHLPLAEGANQEKIEVVRESLKAVLPTIFAEKKQYDDFVMNRDFGNVERISLNNLTGGTLFSYYSQFSKSNPLRHHFG